MWFMVSEIAPDRRELSSEARLREPCDPGYYLQELKDAEVFPSFHLSKVSSNFIAGRRAPSVFFAFGKKATSLPEGGKRSATLLSAYFCR